LRLQDPAHSEPKCINVEIAEPAKLIQAQRLQLLSISTEALPHIFFLVCNSLLQPLIHAYSEADKRAAGMFFFNCALKRTTIAAAFLSSVLNHSFQHSIINETQGP